MSGFESRLHLISVATFLGVVGLMLAARALLGRRGSMVEGRLARLAGGPMEADVGEEEGGLRALLARVGRLLRPSSEDEISSLRQKLVHAGFPEQRAVEMYMGARAGVALLLVLLYLVFVQPEGPAARTLFVIMCCVMAGFFVLPRFFLNHRVAERKRAILSSLPDTLDLLLTCLDAGQPLHAALERVAREMQLAAPVLGEELQQTVAHIRAGMAQEVAFRKLAERAGIEELSVLAALLHQAQVYGTSIAQTLRAHSDSLRAHRVQRAEQDAATAAVRMTLPMILFILPALMIALMGPAIVQVVRQLIPAFTGAGGSVPPVVQ